MRYIIIILSIAFIFNIKAAEASVLCKTKNGSAKIRDACKKMETEIDASQLGIRGPQGEPGPQGPQGPQGVASALPPQQFECVSTVITGSPIDANSATYFDNPSCPNGYVATTPYCWTGAKGIYSQGSGFNSNVTTNRTYCAWQNTTNASQTVYGGNICCRVPANP